MRTYNAENMLPKEFLEKMSNLVVDIEDECGTILGVEIVSNGIKYVFDGEKFIIASGDK